jgi:hypothetical protein
MRDLSHWLSPALGRSAGRPADTSRSGATIASSGAARLTSGSTVGAKAGTKLPAVQRFCNVLRGSHQLAAAQSFGCGFRASSDGAES